MKVIAFLIFNLLLVGSLWGDDFEVTNNADSGIGSLRRAIDDLNTSFSVSNTVTFDTGLGTITLLSDLPLIGIEGRFITSANDSLVIDGSAGPYRIFGSSDVSINLNVPSSSTLTVSGLIDQGTLIASGSGSLILDGINAYTGGTSISAGLRLALVGTGVLASNGGVVINSSTLDISAIAPPSQTIGVLSGSGAGEIVLGTKELIVNNSFDTTYPGLIRGSGSFTKQGAGILLLTGGSNSSVFTGNVAVNAGTLLVDGVLEGTLTVSPNAILGGNGTVGTVVNNGNTEPGSSIGTLTVNGNYTQSSSGVLGIEINETGAADLLQVTGTATLSGTLRISPEPGVYLAGTTYTFLTAGTVTGQFSSSFSDFPLNYVINYFPDQAQLLLIEPSLFLPSRPNGNAGAVVDYLFCSSFNFGDVDLDTVAGSLLILSADQYKKALNRLTPSQFGALALTELESNFAIANSFFQTRLDQKSCCIDMCKSTSVWINPLGFIYSQKSHLETSQEAIDFTNHTYGITAGMDHMFSDHWNLGLGLGYAYSQVHWKDQAGKAYADSGYLGPYLKYGSRYFYFDFLILGAGNFYDVQRKIQFPGLFRQAKSHPRNWNLSEIVLTGFNLETHSNFFVRPEVLLDQLNIFQEDFRESGAGSIDLSVKRKYSAFLRSLINLKFVKEWVFCSTCIIPSVNVGWLRTTPLSSRNYTASFRADTFCQPNFSVTSFNQSIDQILTGAQFLITSQEGFTLSLGYDGKFGESAKVHEINAALDWKF